MPAPANRTPLLLSAAAVGLILLAVVAVLMRQPAPVPPPAQPRVVAEAPKPTPTPQPKATATPEPTPEMIERGPGEDPLPSPIPPSDPMAEFRVARFTGKVLDGITYKPLANARVTEFVFEDGNFNFVPGYPPVVDETTSDAGGDFRFSDRPVGRGEVLAWQATLEGYTSTMLLFPAGEGLGDRLRSTFLLRPAGAIAGVVLDETGAPVPNATVGDMIVGNFQKPGTPGENTVPSTHAQTDAKGAFRLVGLEAGQKFPIPVRAKGFVDFMSDPVEVGREDLVFKLTRADAALRGRVVDWEKSGARGVKVSLRSVTTRVKLSTPLVRTTSTASDGSFHFPGLVSGEYRLNAELDVPDSLGPGCRVDAEITLLMNDEKQVELQLPAPARIEGRFVEPETNKGVAGVKLYRLIDEVLARERAYNTESDASGNFAFTAFVPADEGGYEVRIPVKWGDEWFPLPNDKQPDNVRVEQDTLSFMNVKPGEERTGVAVHLGPGHELTGTVIEPDGSTPAVDTPVYFRGERFFTSMNTDGEGRFRLSLPAGLSLRLESSTEQGIAATTLKTSATNAPVRLLLQRYGVLSGDLKDSDGAPLGDILVAVQRDTEGAFKDAIRFEEKGMARGDGSWRIENVAPGPLALLPELSNAAAFAPPKPLEVDLIPGEELSDLHIVLEAGDYIDGTVVDDATGKGIAGVTIFTNMREVAAESDADGRFRLDGIPYDTALDTVTASVAGYGEETRRNVSIYDKELNFRLKPQVSVEVRAIDGGGQPIATYRLRVLSFRSDIPGGGGQVLREVAVNDSNGVYTVGKMAAGAYRAEVSELRTDGSAGRTGAQDFTVANTGNPKQVVEVRLDAELRLTGTVVTAGSELPVAGAEVELLDPPLSLGGARGPNSRGFLTTTDAGGRFSIGPLAAGTYRLRAEHEGSASQVVSAALSADSGSVTIPIESRPRLYGALNGPDGEAVRRATIFVMDANGVPSGSSLTATGGRYDINLPAAGTWQVVFSQDDTPNVMTRSVTLAAGGSQQLDIDFSSRVTLTGRLLANGAPAASGLAALLRSANGEEVLAAARDSSGSYSVELSPGLYDLHYSSGQVTAPTWTQVTVNNSPAKQQQDLNLRVGALDLVVVAADEKSINGTLTLESSSPQGGAVTVLRGYRVDRVSMRFLQLPAGSYRGVLYRDGDSVSASDWIAVPAGGSGTMTLDWR